MQNARTLFLVAICMLSLLAGCNAKKESKEAKEYMGSVAAYTVEVNDYSKDATEIVASDKNLNQKSSTLLNKTTKMRKEIKIFNAIEPPRTLRHVHRKIVAQNYLLDDSLYVLESSIKAGKVTSSALSAGMQKVKPNETTQKIAKLIKLFKNEQKKKS
ncbi:hypothetical protein CN918_30150 [Priestia megaterium]|nr:hypothetical protein CN918_30150 [Priestia megaterium]